MSTQTKSKKVQKKKPVVRMKEKLSDFYGHIESIANGEESIPRKYYKPFKEKIHMMFLLNYPNEVPYFLIIPKVRSIAHIVQEVAKAYRDVIYANPNKYKISLHGIEDLVIEGVITTTEGPGHIMIGS